MHKSILLTFLLLPMLLIGQSKTDNLERLIEQYLIEADTLYTNQNYGEALPLYLKIDSIALSNNFENFNTIKALIKRAEISRLAFTRESTNLAYDLAEEALERSEKINLQEGIHYSYVHLSDLAQMRKEFEKSKQYSQLALDYYLENRNDKWVSLMYLIQSVYYIESDSADVGKADIFRYKAIEYLEDKNNDYEMAKAKYYYGHFLRYDRKQFRKAISFLEDSRILYEKVDRNEDELYHRCLRDLAICYDEVGEYKKSQEYYKQAYNLKIELNKRANRNTSRRLETQYQAEKKAQEIALLKSENKLIEQQRENQRNTLIAGIVIAGIAGVFMFVLFRNRKKTADKLKELDVAKSRFFENISHEFRTPLTLISNPIEETLEDESLSNEKKERFQMAKRNVNRLLELVNQLLDLSKIDSQKLSLNIQKDNVTQLISALANTFKFSADHKKINYFIDIDTYNNDVYFDKDALEKIVVNLLSNAVKYTPQEGKIYCHARIENDTLIFQVKNTGVGLTKAEQKNIFQRFYQTTEDNIGSGIGLSLVKELVDLHKGTITLNSEPEVSTEFIIKLPVDKESFKNENFNISKTTDNYASIDREISVTINDSEEFAENDQPILLVVEDNEDVRTLLKQSFKSTYNILTAENGQVGIDLALEHIPDIIISDVMMPVKDGIELANTLKNDERTSHIPLILLTAKAGDDNELTGIETGADDYMTKPFNSKILSAKVAKLIESRQKLQNRYSQELVLMPTDIAVNQVDEQFLDKVQSVLDDNLVDASFNIDEFSKAVGMSRMQLHRKLKALVGLSAGDFIRSQRLKLAADLLKKSDSNVSQVGYSVGFNDHSYFSKRFKEAYNCTPSEFAKQHS